MTKQKYPLVLVEWQDSAQPIANWVFLSDFDKKDVIKCVSVGWLIHDHKKLKILAPNLGDADDNENIQASGIIRIPTSCVIKLQKIN